MKEGGRTMHELGIQGPNACPACHQTSLTKHKLKDEIIKNFKTVITEHSAPSEQGRVEMHGSVPMRPALPMA